MSLSWCVTRVELIAYSPAADVVLIRRVDGLWLVHATGERRINEAEIGRAVVEGGLVRGEEAFDSHSALDARLGRIREEWLGRQPRPDEWLPEYDLTDLREILDTHRRLIAEGDETPAALTWFAREALDKCPVARDDESLRGELIGILAGGVASTNRWPEDVKSQARETATLDLAA